MHVDPLERRVLFSAGLPKDLAGDTLADAMDVGAITRTRPAIVEGLVHENDRRDVFRFDVTRAGTFTVLLDEPTANVNLKLFDADGKLLERSDRAGRKDDFITRRLTSGTYFVRARFAGDDEPARYTFKTFRGDDKAAAPAALPATASAAATKGVAIFIDIDGIDGESESEKYEGQIEVLSYSFGVINETAPTGGGGAGTGKAVFNDVVITKTLDSTTPQLMLLAAQGKHIQEVVITLAAANGSQRKFMTYTLNDVVITQLTSTGTAGATKSRPRDLVSFEFSQIELEFQPPGKTQPVTAGWDIAGNKVV